MKKMLTAMVAFIVVVLAVGIFLVWHMMRGGVAEIKIAMLIATMAFPVFLAAIGAAILILLFRRQFGAGKDEDYLPSAEDLPPDEHRDDWYTEEDWLKMGFQRDTWDDEFNRDDWAEADKDFEDPYRDKEPRKRL